jgi:hypothetical protein
VLPILVVHPRVVENYRSAHEIALRLGKTQNYRGSEDGDDSYRSLFEELVLAPRPLKGKRWRNG